MIQARVVSVLITDTAALECHPPRGEPRALIYPQVPITGLFYFLQALAKSPSKMSCWALFHVA
jgi:hypothetical protein